MLCEKCKKNPASIIIKQTTANGAITHHLCPECSFKFAMPIPFEIPTSYEDLFQGIMATLQSMAQNEAGSAAKKKAVKCPVCGMTYEQFKATSRFGCAECYTTFSTEMDVLLKNVQGNIRHEGKYPRRSGVELRQKREAVQLRGMLKEAVDNEDFEEAASLRDRIKLLETQS